MTPPTASDLHYARELPFQSRDEELFDALTTLDGLAGWWTPIVSGNPASGEVRFGFAGLDEEIVMRVDQATRPTTLVWTCLTHTGHPEWEDTRIVFELEPDETSGGLLKFRHVGLIPRLSCYEICETGWERFLVSLLDYAEHGKGHPF